MYMCVYIVQDVEESASVAVQLTRRGKGEGRGGGMDIESLREFLRQVDTLPCRVPEAKLLEVSYCSTCVYVVPG